MGVKFFEDSNALDSLRSSDFDALSAYGEVIDNSIQAEAKNISLIFEKSRTQRTSTIDHLAFGDDGQGMDAATIASCLKLGWSSRFNDRTGIGRFGVGMVLGAIHECKRIEVFSKRNEDEKWLWTYIDLDEIEEGKIEEIPVPKNKKIPDRYIDLVGSQSGTLVLWSKYDRQKESADKIISDSHQYIGRTFRKFIWSDINIKIDGELVKAHDPLFLNVNKTQFPNDPVSKEYEPFEFQWPIRDEKIQKKWGEMGTVKIRMSLLPEELRPYQGSGGSKESKLRQIDDQQQGISILREGREVFFGTIPYWSFVKMGKSTQNTWSFTEIDRFWGCEISFGAELDTAFEVKNIKRGARPEPDLLKLIKEKITPTRKAANEAVSDYWTKIKQENDKKNDESNSNLKRHSSHAKVENVAKNSITTASKLNQELSPEDVVKKHLEKVHLDETQKQGYRELFSAQPYTIADDEGWRGSTFWEVTTGGNKIFMSYNLKHEFLKELRKLEQEISDETDREKLKSLSKKITAMVDLLLVSYAKATSQFDNTETVSVDDLIGTLNENWGQTLRSFVKKWTED